MGHYRRGKKNSVVELNGIDMAVVMPDVSSLSHYASVTSSTNA
jgi:hypothetical protein